MSLKFTKSNTDNEPWVQVQQKAMIKWMNNTIQDYDQLELPSVTSCPTQISNLKQDLQSGLVVIKLINRLVFDYHKVQAIAKSKGNTTTNYHYDKLYYITPIYSNPKFKLQKIENLNDVLKFLRLILKLNTSNISSDNIFDGDLKLTLGLIWSLYLFNMSSKFMTSTDTSSFFQIKQIIFNWLNPIVPIANFHKDWIQPVPIFMLIFNHYSITLPPSSDLTNIISFMLDDLHIPILIDVDDFPVDGSSPDEKCIVTLCVELYKYFEVDKNRGNIHSSIFEEDEVVDDGDFNELVEFITYSNKLKNKFETKSLRFINRINSTLNELTDNHETFNQMVSTIDNDLKNTIDLLFETINQKDAYSTPFINQCLNNFNQLSFKFATITKILDSFITIRHNNNELVNDDYNEIKQLLIDLNSRLTSIDLIYYPNIKSLNIDNLNLKIQNLSQINQNYSLILSQLYQTIHQNERLNELISQKASLNKVGHKTLSMECVSIMEDIQSFVNKTDSGYEQSSSLTINVDSTITSITTIASSRVSKSKLAAFKSKLRVGNNDNLTHFQLIKLLKSTSSLNLDQTNIDKLIKLIPLKSIIISSHSFSSTLSNGTLSTDDDYDEDDDEEEEDIVDRKKNKKSLIFDELQQKLDSELSGTRNKVYDVNEFLHKLENGFKL
ncbi:calponin homology domain-containing protein [Scheffersomyces coipomensis]|uniref:calponin homology domain-containing protein n=1 Tax=Scheffersomyces coipomensis TaxID=1788519 RepID=UPI00315DF11B